jgi:hypothetical protein
MSAFEGGSANVRGNADADADARASLIVAMEPSLVGNSSR